MPIASAAGALSFAVGLTPQDIASYLDSDEDDPWDALQARATQKTNRPTGTGTAATRRSKGKLRRTPGPCMQASRPPRTLEPTLPERLTPLLTATVWRGPSEAPSGDACRPVSPGCGGPPLALALLCAARSRLSLA